MISNYIKGFFKVLSSFGSISHYGLWFYLFLSGALGLIVGGAIFYTAYESADDIGAWLVSYYPFNWGEKYILKLADFLGGSMVLIFGVILYKYIIMAVTSPIMSFVSERVEYVLTASKSEDFSMGRMLGELWRGIRIAITNFYKEILLIIALFILGLVLPFLAPFIAVLTFLVQAYFVGYGSLDYYMERRFDYDQSNDAVKKNKWGVLGIGSAFLLLILVPVIGWVFGPILATIAATEYAIEERIG